MRRWGASGSEEHVVVGPVICALEFRHQVPAGPATGETYGVHGGFCPGIGEAKPIGPLDRSEDFFGGLDLAPLGHGESGAILRRRYHCLDDIRIGVAKIIGPQAHW